MGHGTKGMTFCALTLDILDFGVSSLVSNIAEQFTVPMLFLFNNRFSIFTVTSANTSFLAGGKVIIHNEDANGDVICNMQPRNNFQCLYIPQAHGQKLHAQCSHLPKVMALVYDVCYVVGSKP